MYKNVLVTTFSTIRLLTILRLFAIFIHKLLQTQKQKQKNNLVEIR